VGAFDVLARSGATIFSAGLALALPLIAALLIVNLSLGILNRSAPQLTVFSVGFPMSLTLGLALVSVLMTDLGRYLDALFGQGLQTLQAMIQALAPI
jgi:flagellar biosynthetic protein FliR